MYRHVGLGHTGNMAGDLSSLFLSFFSSAKELSSDMEGTIYFVPSSVL